MEDERKWVGRSVLALLVLAVFNFILTSILGSIAVIAVLQQSQGILPEAERRVEVLEEKVEALEKKLESK